MLSALDLEYLRASTSLVSTNSLNTKLLPIPCGDLVRLFASIIGIALYVKVV